MLKTIRSRLMAGYLAVFAMFLIVIASTYFATDHNRQLVSQAINQEFGSSLAVSELAVLAQKIRRYEKEFFIYIGDDEKQTKYSAEWQETYQLLEGKLDALIANPKLRWETSEAMAFDQWRHALQSYQAGFVLVLDQVRQGIITDTLSANSAIQEAKNRFRVFVDGTSELAERKYHDAVQVNQTIGHYNDVLNIILLATLGFTALICGVVVTVIPNTVIRPIRTLSKSAQTMSMGDLDQAVPTRLSVDDFKELAETLERMRISTRAMLSQLKTIPLKQVA